MSEEKRLKKDYDPEFREQAAKLVLNEKMSVTAVAKDLGIPVSSVHTWVRKFRQGIWHLSGEVSSSNNAIASKTRETQKLPSSSQKQHDRLQQLESSHRDLEIKLRRMTMERDILKKAMAYCLDVPK